MTTRFHFIFTAVLLLMVPLSLRAQNAQPSSPSKGESPNRQVIGSVSESRIRFTSLGDLIQLRLEVFGPAGEILFDSEFKAGNVVDWPASEVKGQQPGDGTYLFVVSVKDATGEILKKYAIGVVRDQSVSLRETDKSLLSSAQSASVTTGEEFNVTIVEAGAVPAATLAHDGVTAHLVSGRGGLTISSGDFFANKLLEHMRITAEGNVGIGVASPKARLEVAGRIRSTEGIVFPDGSVQFSAARKTLGAASLRDGQSEDKSGEGQGIRPEIAGTGTTGKISKWLDGPNGVLTDSVISELNGSIGINGTPDPTYKLDVAGHNRFRGSNVSFYLTGSKVGGNEWLFQTIDADGRLRIFENSTGGGEKLSLTQSGNVGIGIPAPSQKLHVVGNGLFTGDLTVNGTLNATLPIGSVNYIQNGTSLQQAPSNFNIGGNGTVGGTLQAGNVNVSAGYEFLGNSILRISGVALSSLNVGLAAGHVNIGNDNTFVGSSSGFNNVSGAGNAFFGTVAGRQNTSGSFNSFFGGASTEGAVTDGTGFHNTTGSFNSFFGHRAGEANNTGDSNSFFGTGAGLGSVSGSDNTFLGHDAGNTNTTGSFNTVVGESADVSAASLTNATAIGSKSLVSQSNSLVLGSINGVNNATANTNVGIGTTAPNSRLHVSGAGVIRARINSDSNAGLALGLNDQNLWSIANVSPGHFQIFNDRLGQNALSISTFDNSVGIGTLGVSGIITVSSLGNVGSTALCRNASNQISLCSSSIRYKHNINPFSPGLSLINRLRPVSFNWRADNQEDLGLVAEEVAEVEPLLVTHNDKGEIEGVKYDRIGVVLINALKEQQGQLEQYRAQLRTQQAEIFALKEQQGQLEQYRAQLRKQQADIVALKDLVRAAIVIRRPANRLLRRNPGVHKTHSLR